MRRGLLSLALLGLLSGCTESVPQPEKTQSLFVDVRLPGPEVCSATPGCQCTLPSNRCALPLPAAGEAPLPLPAGFTELDFSVYSVLPDGSHDSSFEGFVRISAVPASVVDLSGDRVSGRNVLLLEGKSENQHVRLRNARGPTRLWAEDIGYVPEDPAKPPLCADGADNDDDGLVDFPQDPGCAFANDHTEGGGTYAAGASAAVRFALPRLGEVQGRGAATPYELEAVDVHTDAPSEIIVTRIAADGFYATDVADPAGYNHVFAFTFNTPPFLRVCDRITQLSGTAMEFFGFTEMSFPSFERHAWRFPTPTDPGDGPCKVPEPVILGSTSAMDDAQMEKIESALVSVQNVTIGAYFGPGNPQFDLGGQPDCKQAPLVGFGEASSNCDLDGSGFIDFDTPGSCEAACANACGADPQCVEWTGFVSRGNYRVVFPDQNSLQINTRAIAGFDPPSMRGKPISSLTGTLRHFSGGALNWTIEARCGDDLVCTDPGQKACVDGPKAPVSSQIACVSPRTTDDPNEGTN